MRSFVFPLFIGLAVLGSACRPEGGSTCELPEEGRWNLEATHLGTRTYRATLHLDPSTCSFWFEDWEAEPADLIDGGQVEQRRVTVFGADYWSTCSGAMSMGGAMMSGTCDDETDFHFMYDAPGDGSGGHQH